MADIAAALQDRLPHYDDLSADEIVARTGASEVHLFASVQSTMDVAHAVAAAGAPSGTIVLADAQLAGRGRHGKPWISEAGQGIWLTLLERPDDRGALGVLSVRCGLALARALDAFASARVHIKWPNDLYLEGGKLAGVLVEARWRDARVDWIAIGVGLNVARAAVAGAAALRDGIRRRDVLCTIVPPLRAAARCRGPLTDAELSDYASRDYARGRNATSPASGIVAGISPDGALVVDTPNGIRAVAAGTLLLDDRS